MSRNRMAEGTLNQPSPAAMSADISVEPTPVEMLEKWDEAQKHYVEKAAWIKTMLAM